VDNKQLSEGLFFRFGNSAFAENATLNATVFLEGDIPFAALPLPLSAMPVGSETGDVWSGNFNYTKVSDMLANFVISIDNALTAVGISSDRELISKVVLSYVSSCGLRSINNLYLVLKVQKASEDPLETTFLPVSGFFLTRTYG
jgi:hypothetical protein